MRKRAFLIAALAAVSMAPEAAAQLPVPLSVEARADFAFPAGEFAEDVKNGIGWGVNAALGVARGVGVYGGYSRTEFDLEVLDGDVIDTGFAVGLTTSLPTFSRDVSPWVGGGILFHDVEVDLGAVSADSDTDVGFELGAGLALWITPTLRLTPGFGFRRFSTTLFGVDRDATYVTAGAGLNFSF